MSWGTCYSGSNNIHFDFPPIMEDGRNYASWQPEAVINKRIQKKEDIKSNWEYRQFMTHNGLEIMKYNTLESCYTLGLNTNSNETNNKTLSNIPFLFTTTQDNRIPTFGYSDSDLKTPYLSRQQLNARMISPAVTVPYSFGGNNVPQPHS